MDGSFADEYKDVRERLVLQLIMSKDNETVLQDHPCRMLPGMILICRIKENIYSGGCVNPAVTREMLQRWGVSEEQLFTDAFRSAPRNEPAVFRRIEDVLRELTDTGTALTAEGSPLYVATVQSRVSGACVIAYPGFLKAAADFIGGDYFILPSSVHEILILPEPYAPEVTDLEAMVRQINEKVVAPSDRLSDQVFYYDAAEDRLETGTQYCQRKDKETLPEGCREASAGLP